MKVKRYIWKIVNSVQSSSILPSTFRTKMLILLGTGIHTTASIAEKVHIGSNNLIMGKETFINIGGFMDGCAPVVLEDYVRCGPYVKILTGTHSYRDSVIRRRAEDGVMCSGVTIKRGCWIGMGSIIMPGVIVAEGCIIAAGSVVVRNTDPNGLYAGVPAKRIKNLSTRDDDFRD